MATCLPLCERWSLDGLSASTAGSIFLFSISNLPSSSSLVFSVPQEESCLLALCWRQHSDPCPRTARNSLRDVHSSSRNRVWNTIFCHLFLHSLRAHPCTSWRSCAHLVTYFCNDYDLCCGLASFMLFLPTCLSCLRSPKVLCPYTCVAYPLCTCEAHVLACVCTYKAHVLACVRTCPCLCTHM